MISKVLFAFERGVKYVKNHPHILFALLLVIVLPLSFLYSGNQFLDAGKSNQERLENERIGLMHDVFISLIEVSNANAVTLQSEIVKIATLNPDIVAFKISQKTTDGFIPIASLYDEEIGKVEEESQIYNYAFTRPDESVVDVITDSSDRFLRGVRLVELNDSSYVILTVTSRASVDALFNARKQTAYITLGLIYMFVLAIAFWHVRLTDYRYLYKKARKSIETKDLFTNMITHELRAPLTAIKGYASMIEESSESKPEEGKYAVRIRESSERLLGIVNDLLDVARMQSGKLKIEKTEASISEVVVSVCEELTPSALEKEIILSYSGTEEEHNAQTDSKRLHQAITNLVSNAIKYTKQGSIELAVEEKAVNIELRVKDTGMGISAKDQKQLFAPFFRVENDDVSQITGTGLGMWITRQLIELMGATVGVESIKGVGTHIVVTIPK